MTPDEPIASWQAERLYRRKHPIRWWVSIVYPFLIAILALCTIAITNGVASASRFLITCVLILAVFGKLIIAGGYLSQASGSEPTDSSSMASFYSPEELMGIAMFVDFLIVSLVVFHLGALFRLPWIGHRLKRMVEFSSRFLNANSWMKRVTYLGLIGFVALPITGGLSGAIMGRLLGISKYTTMLCCMLGSAIGCLLVYCFSEWMVRMFGSGNRLAILAGALGVIVLIYVGYRTIKPRPANDT
jgi:uncharacterized membrane protein